MISENLGKDYVMVTVHDKEYKLAPLSINAFSSIEQHLKDVVHKELKQNIDNLKSLELPEDIFKEQIRDLLSNNKKVTEDDVEAYTKTLDGARYLLLYSFKKYQPDIPDTFVDDIPLEELEDILKKITPDIEDVSSNSTPNIAEAKKKE